MSAVRFFAIFAVITVLSDYLRTLYVIPSTINLIDNLFEASKIFSPSVRYVIKMQMIHHTLITELLLLAVTALILQTGSHVFCIMFTCVLKFVLGIVHVSVKRIFCVLFGAMTLPFYFILSLFRQCRKLLAFCCILPSRTNQSKVIESVLQVNHDLLSVMEKQKSEITECKKFAELNCSHFSSELSRFAEEITGKQASHVKDYSEFSREMATFAARSTLANAQLQKKLSSLANDMLALPALVNSI